MKSTMQDMLGELEALSPPVPPSNGGEEGRAAEAAERAALIADIDTEFAAAADLDASHIYGAPRNLEKNDSLEELQDALDALLAETAALSAEDEPIFSPYPFPFEEGGGRRLPSPVSITPYGQEYGREFCYGNPQYNQYYNPYGYSSYGYDPYGGTSLQTFPPHMMYPDPAHTPPPAASVMPVVAAANPTPNTDAALAKLAKQEKKHQGKHNNRKHDSKHRNSVERTVGDATGSLTQTAAHYAPVAIGGVGGAVAGAAIGSAIIPGVGTYLGAMAGLAIGGTGGKIAGDIGDAIFGGVIAKSTSWGVSHLLKLPKKVMKHGLATYSGTQLANTENAADAVKRFNAEYGDGAVGDLKGARRGMKIQQHEAQEQEKFAREQRRAQNNYRQDLLSDLTSDEKYAVEFTEERDAARSQLKGELKKVLEKSPNALDSYYVEGEVGGLDNDANLDNIMQEFAGARSVPFGNRIKGFADTAHENNELLRTNSLSDESRNRVNSVVEQRCAAKDVVSTFKLEEENTHNKVQSLKNDGHVAKHLRRELEGKRNPVQWALS